MALKRIEPGKRMNAAGIHNGTVYPAGHTPEMAQGNPEAEQTTTPEADITSDPHGTTSLAGQSHLQERPKTSRVNFHDVRRCFSIDSTLLMHIEIAQLKNEWTFPKMSGLHFAGRHAVKDHGSGFRRQWLADFCYAKTPFCAYCPAGITLQRLEKYVNALAGADF